MSIPSSPETTAQSPPSAPADTPLDAAVAPQTIPQDTQPHRWSLAARIAFRLAFCYLGGYCIFNGNATIWSVVPVLGPMYADALARIFLLPAQSLAHHLFHVAGPGVALHPTGSGDTAIDWIALLLLFAVSLVATALWSVLDRRRPHYQTLYAWLRFLIRLTLGIGMLVYGMAKLFPLQMAPPSVSSLAEPLGMHSPMALLWNFIGLNPRYEIICGAAEFLAGLMILFRRTALAGAIFTVFVVANILLYNLFFDVPVKLYAGHLLLLALFVILPDAKPLFRFFWMHEPAAPIGVWVPPASRRWFRRATLIVEIAFVMLALGELLIGNGRYYWLDRRTDQLAITRCDLCRAWRIEPPAASVSNQPDLAPLFGVAATDLTLNSPTQAVLHDALGNATYVPIKIDDAHHTLELDGPGKNKTIFAVARVNPMYLTLTPVGDKSGNAASIALFSLTPESGYPLLHRGFHWISEYPFQR